MTPEILSAIGKRIHGDIEKKILEDSEYSTIEEYKQDNTIGDIAEDFYDILREYNKFLPPFPLIFLDSASSMCAEWIGKTKGIDDPKKYLEEIGPLKASELALEYAAESEK